MGGTGFSAPRPGCSAPGLGGGLDWELGSCAFPSSALLSLSFSFSSWSPPHQSPASQGSSPSVLLSRTVASSLSRTTVPLPAFGLRIPGKDWGKQDAQGIRAGRGHLSAIRAKLLLPR